ncbi:MAG: aminotransferase class I/II-fold pyridoxal phosphate-dependent enzyme [Thermoanaerobaculia bacterium]
MRLPDFKLERYFARWEFRADFLLCASDIEGWRLDELLSLADEECRALWANLRLGYTESPGHPQLRQEIAGLYETVSADNVLCFAGAEEAIFILANVLLGPGTHAVVTWPAYQSLYEVARATGAEVTLLPLDPVGWRLDPEALRRAVRPSTRLIVINFPHNPTGALADRKTFFACLEIARETGCALLSDEVYRFLEFDPVQRLPAAVDVSASGISLGVMSKAFGLAGLRIGWIATRDSDLLRRAAAFKDYTTICNSAPSEILALIALRARETVLARNRELVAENLAHLDRFFAGHEDLVSWVRPRAGSVAFPRLSPGLPAEEFCRDLLEKEGVLLLPGSAFEYPGEHFRIGFGRKNLPDALSRLEHFIEARARRVGS